jgi:hypothetical protein
MPIRKCDCSAELSKGAVFQDKEYGMGRRVHTIGKGSAPRYVCTVCGKGMRAKDALLERELEKARAGL